MKIHRVASTSVRNAIAAPISRTMVSGLQTYSAGFDARATATQSAAATTRVAVTSHPPGLTFGHSDGSPRRSPRHDGTAPQRARARWRPTARSGRTRRPWTTHQADPRTTFGGCTRCRRRDSSRPGPRWRRPEGGRRRRRRRGGRTAPQALPDRVGARPHRVVGAGAAPGAVRRERRAACGDVDAEGTGRSAVPRSVRGASAGGRRPDRTGRRRPRGGRAGGQPAEPGSHRRHPDGDGRRSRRRRSAATRRPRPRPVRRRRVR